MPIYVRLFEVISYYSLNTDEMDKGDQGHCADVVFQGPRGLKTVIEVSKGQQGNVLLRHFKNRGWTFAETDPDFVIGERACVVFVSLKYHLLQPEYVKARISELQCFDICIVLCLIDAEDVFATLHGINRAAGMGACPLVCAWSAEEAARYVEFFFSCGSVAQEEGEAVVSADYISNLFHFLGSVHGMKNIDSAALCAHFGTLTSVLRTSMKEMLGCPGFGKMKACRLHEIFHCELT